MVRWNRPLQKLSQASVHSSHGNSSVLKLLHAQGADSGTYICTASNPLGTTAKQAILIVVTLPKFTIKPPEKVNVFPGDSLTLNCSATGDPRPVISWKRVGAQLPVGRSHMLNGALIVRNVQKEDGGIYVCLATSAGVFDKTVVSNVQVTPIGKSIAHTAVLSIA